MLLDDVREVEHRPHASPPVVSVALALDPPRLEVGEMVEESALTELDEAVIDAMVKSAPMSRTALRDRLRVRNERLVRLEGAGRVTRPDPGWAVPRSGP